MKLAIGIILLLVALWFLYGTIRMWPPDRRRPRMLWPSTRADIVRGVFLVVANCVTGVALIRGASWWWLLIAGIAVVAWVTAEGRLRRHRLEEAISSRTAEVQEHYTAQHEERDRLRAFLACVTPLNVLQQEIAHDIANAGKGLPRDEHNRTRIISDRLEALASKELDLLNRLKQLSPPDSCIGIIDKWTKASQLRLGWYPLMQQNSKTYDMRASEDLRESSIEVDGLHRKAEKELEQICKEHNIKMTFLKG